MARNNNKEDKTIWTALSSTELFKSPFFRMRSDALQFPDGRIMSKYYVFEFSDWVNIIPITKTGEVVLIRQYRHAAGTVMIEIPGGAVDCRFNEEPEAAGIRELAEETGYVPEKVELIGWHNPNPAMLNNKLWTYLAQGCELKQAQKLDEFEDIEVFTASVDELLEMVANGQIKHSLILASLFLALKHLPLKSSR